MAESLGQYFRRAREHKGWTLEEAAVKTRILCPFLKAVEEDNYEQLPAEVFAKGFVRSYGHLLGLPETEVLSKFEESGRQFYAKRDEREQLKLRIREEARRKKTNKFIVAGIVGLALIALLIATGMNRDAARPVSAPPTEPAPSRQKSAHPVLPSQPTPPPVESEAQSPKSESEATVAVPVEVEGNFSPGLPLEGILPVATKLVLEVEAVERAWVLVQADHDPAQEVMLSPGERVRWSADQKLKLTLGNAGGVRISLNGKLQGPYGGSGKVIKDLTFTR
jgi:cytoskeleton protein RodZ